MTRLIQRVRARHIDWYDKADDACRFPIMCATRRGVSVSPAVDPAWLPEADRDLAAAVAQHLADDPHASVYTALRHALADVNPREHDLPALRASISRFGFADPPDLDERTGKLVAGHGRLAALTAMRDDGETAPQGVRTDDQGQWLVPITRGWASRSDVEAVAYLVSNNRQTERARWDQQGLADALSSVADADRDLMHAAGYSDGDHADLLRTLEPDDLDGDGGGGGSKKDDVDDGLTLVEVKVPHHLSSAWQAHLDGYDGNGTRALGQLLGAL